MRDENFHELLGDDGEFIEALDTSYGVYSVHRHGFWRHIIASLLALTVGAVLIFSIWQFYAGYGL